MPVGEVDEERPESTRPRRRGRRVGQAVGLVVAAFAIGGAALFWWQTRLTFPYEGPSDPVEPGALVEIRAPGEACGPLIVTLHSPSILGRWNQTHSGNAIDDSFTRDEHSWWSLSSRTTMTPVPCRMGGVITFTLPLDVTESVIAACDQDNRCGKVHVTQPTNG